MAIQNSVFNFRPFNRINVQVLTSTGTYTPTAGMTHCIVEVQGGGGGSGGVVATGAVQAGASGGGASGGYARSLLTAEEIGASQSYTIGAGGSAGAAGNNDGGDGGTTTLNLVSGSISATGGGRGRAMQTALTSGQVSMRGSSIAAGVGSGGNICNLRGFLANNAACVRGGTSFTNCPSTGGNGLYGKGATIPSNSPTANSGAGGSGVVSGASASAAAGIAGAAGIIIITEFISANFSGFGNIINASPSSSLIKTVNYQVFTSSGTYTPTSGMKYCIVEVQGGGGNGAGTTTVISWGGGGGGGGFCKQLYSASQCTSASISIGTNANTTFTPSGGGATLTGGVGSNGNAAIVVTNQTAPGPARGGSASGGFINLEGCPSINGIYKSSGNLTFAGAGGAGYMSTGTTPTPVISTSGADGAAGGTNTGAGGNGAVAITGTGTRSGGTGAAGLVLITEYIG